MSAFRGGAGHRSRTGRQRLLAIPDTAYLHAHFAGAGCFACRIEPA
jgi:Protein of unknown function (DUF1203)